MNCLYTLGKTNTDGDFELNSTFYSVFFLYRTFFNIWTSHEYPDLPEYLISAHRLSSVDTSIYSYTTEFTLLSDSIYERFRYVARYACHVSKNSKNSISCSSRRGKIISKCLVYHVYVCKVTGRFS